MAELRLEGLDDVRQKLRELPGSVERRIIRAALKDVATRVEHRLRAAAPNLTGKLRFNIGVRLRTRRGAPVAFVTIQQSGKAESPTNAFYWRFLEFGTKHIQAQSFFTRSWESQKERVANEIAERIARGVEVTVKRIEKRSARETRAAEQAALIEGGAE